MGYTEADLRTLLSNVSGKKDSAIKKVKKSKYNNVKVEVDMINGAVLKQRVEVAPLSVNQVWKGKRYKTDEYRLYEKRVLSLLQGMPIPQPPYEIRLFFGVSSKLSDWDNPVKPFQDILQKKYGFDDKDIVRAVVEKILVQKGGEYIEFELRNLEIKET